MKRRLTTLAAMLLLVGSLMVGAIAVASAQNEVHEADGTWHNSENGPVSFKITWKGTTYIRWKHWVEPEGEDPAAVASWTVDATASQANTKTKVPRNGHRQVRYGNLTMGEDYTIVVKALDEHGIELGRQQVTIRPRHVSPPEPVTGLHLSVGDDNLSVDADWTAPQAGGKPKRYSVWLTNLDTGRARGKVIKVEQGKGGQITLKTNTAFGKLWPGDTYRVSVRTRNQNSRSTWGAGNPQSWQNSAWTHTTISIPAGTDPAYTKVAPTLIWERVLAGEKVPPYVIGEPTAYIVSDHSAPGGYARFDAPNKCREYQDPHPFFLDERNDAAAKKAIVAARSQDLYHVQPAKDALAAAIDKRDDYLSDTPESERSPARIAELDADIARKQRHVDATERNLAVLVAKLETECARAYPVVESLTDDDNRWYQMAQTREVEPTER